nr:anthranilate synthase component I family protein [Bacillus piscicola]
MSFCYPEEKFFTCYQVLSENNPYHVLLESGQKGRFSMAAFTPFAVITGKNGVTSVQTNDGVHTMYGDPLEAMKNWLTPYKTETNRFLPDFQGGVIGYISYDYSRYMEDMPNQAEDDLGTNDLCFLAFHQAFVYDHTEEKLWVIVVDVDEAAAEKELLQLREMWEDCRDASPHYSEKGREAVPAVDEPVTSFTEESFAAAAEKIRSYIRTGDSFQVNLSVRQKQPLHTPPLHIYKKLRELNPSPYMGYFHTPDLQLVSASPELLIKKRGNEVSTRPIAGTRPRGKSEKEDLFYEAQMMNCAKEQAEHIMLVDLERNDIGKVCRYGSVEVDELMVVERYSHVMHIVSNVKGTLAEDMDVYGMIRAAFPGGTITGAPKIRTMEIIEELEPVRRGIYTGSIGWIGFNQDAELNIVIRTLIAKDGAAYVQAGAGVVIDSDPRAEFNESLRKAQALWRAKEMSEAEFGVMSGEEEEIQT